MPDAIGRETCPICIVDFEEGDDLRVLPCEGHHRLTKSTDTLATSRSARTPRGSRTRPLHDRAEARMPVANATAQTHTQ